MKNLYVRLSANVGEFRQQMHAAGASTRQFGNEISGAAASSKASFEKIGRAGMIAGGLIVAGLGMAVVSAAKFERSMRNANSIMHQSEAEFRATSAAVLEMSQRVPQSAENLANGLYDVASSGFQGAEGLKVLEASAIAATAGMTDTATSARAITGVLNAYGMSADDAGRISDLLFQTVNVGVITFEELAQNVGDFISTAAALGITVEETGGALATMTLAGINAAEASTALNRVMSSFIKPTEAMNTALRQLGYESGTAMIDALGLKGAIELINQHANGSVTAIVEMYGEVRAIKGALSLTAAEGENYADVTDAMADASDGAGAAMEAYQEQSKSFLVQLDLAKNSMGAVAIEMGSTFLPVLTSGARVVASVAEAVSTLPGPIRTAVVVATGLAGVITLVGGAAMLAVPRVVAFNASVATISKSSPMAAAALGRLGGAMGLIGKAGMIGAAIGTYAVAMDFLGDKAREALHDAAPNVTALTQALIELGLASKPSGELARAFGDDLNELMADIRMAERDGLFEKDFAGGAADQFVSFFTGKNPAIQAAKDNLKALNESFKELFAQDPEAAMTAWAQLSAQWEASGGDIADLIVQLPEVTAGIDANGVAAAKARADFEALKEQAHALGIDLSETSALAALTADELAEVKDATDPLLFSMLEAGSVTVEQAKVMQDALTAFVEDVESAFSEVTAPIAVYGAALESMNEVAKDAWDKGHDSMDGFVEKSVLSLGEFVTAMQDTERDTRAFLEGIHQAVEMGYDPQLIAQLLQAGPEQAGPILDTLLSDHSGRMVTIVNESVEALRALNEEAVQMARLTHLATTSASDAMVSELGTAMSIAQEKARLGGEATAVQLAQALNLGVAEVRRIAELFGIAIEEGIEGAHPEVTYTIKSAGAPPMQVRARGGIDGPHVAQIAPAGAMRVWAEPETGGEAYIPLASSKRARSRSIWRQTGHLLGMAGGGVLHFDNGGMVQSAADATKFRGALVGVGAMLGGAAGMDTDQLEQVGRAYADLALKVDEATARMLMAQGLGADGYVEATQVILAELEARKEAERRWNDAIRVQYEEGARSGADYITALKEQHAAAAAEYGYWSVEAKALRDTIRAVNADMAADSIATTRILFEEGRASGDDYIAALRAQHDQVAAEYGYWSEEAFAIRETIRGVQDGMASDAEDATDELVGVWERANDKFQAQQDEYREQVERTRATTVDALAGVWGRAQQRFEQQATEYQAALQKRNDAIRDTLRDFHDSIAGPVRDAGDLIATFGRPGALVGGGDEIVAMLEHRVEATQRWEDALRALTSSGLPKELVNQLAQAGPQALGLAEALNDTDPERVNELLASINATGDSLGDLFLRKNRADLTAEASAANPLPARQAMNELLAEETRLWQESQVERDKALAWAESMADDYMPPVIFEWQTLDDLLREEQRLQRRAQADRDTAKAWAEQMSGATLPQLTRSTDAYAAAIRREAAALRELALAGGTTTMANGGIIPARSYDSGGYLPPGVSLAYNGTGRPEPVGHHLGGITVQDGAVRITISAPGGNSDRIRSDVADGVAEGLSRVLGGVRQGVRG